MSMAQSLRSRALQAAEAGSGAEAANLFEQAVAAVPTDPGLLNSAASFFLKSGNAARADALYAAALAIAPTSLEIAINRAIALGRLDRDSEALGLLRDFEAGGRTVARYWSARAALELGMGDRTAAASSYDHCLKIDNRYPRALHGRARVALETGEPDAAERYRTALANGKQTRDLWLGYAQALEQQGSLSEAASVVEGLVATAPEWIEALELLARLRWAMGDFDGFAGHFAVAASGLPRNAALYHAWSRCLAGVDRFAAAADVLRRARLLLPDEPELALAEAVRWGEAGDDARAGAIFANLRLHSSARSIHEARHFIRVGEPDQASRLLLDALDENPGNIIGWALIGICWRLLSDDRAAWLHEQDGLVRYLDLGLAADDLNAARDVLQQLHLRSATPIDQSVRGGTQTRGGLFDRREPALQSLKNALANALDTYREGLPAHDGRHPLLRHRDCAWKFSGSWSIRMAAAGQHVSHVHPQGHISSAAYIMVPETDDGAGSLQLGEPPADLRIGLPPLRVISPVAGRLALFPSTLYHGTSPFEKGERLTVAFDIATG